MLIQDSYINEVLTTLKARLPELEWKINALPAPLSNRVLPAGLFNAKISLTGASLIKEIKTDIHTLALQKNNRSATYLANKIKQKIDVLVTICQINERKQPPEEKIPFGLKMMSTRQQWIQSMEKEISTLTEQQTAMAQTLQQMQVENNSIFILNLQKELGEVEKRLTLHKEALNQAMK